MGVRILKNVVETRLERRGDGTAKNPVRVVTQYWAEDGNFLAEVDDFVPKAAPTGSEELRK